MTVSATAVSVSVTPDMQTAETSAQALQKIVKDRDGGRDQRVSHLALGPRNEVGFTDQRICCIAILIEGVQSKRNEDDETGIMLARV